MRATKKKGTLPKKRAAKVFQINRKTKIGNERQAELEKLGFP